ncbi:MAG TPA: twin-arginine translocase TatA/TatE family subunit [Devosiaceae bacterium]
MNPGPWGILIIVIAVLLLFGRGKISGMMGEVASGIKAFQRGMSEGEKEADQIEAKEADKTKDA